MPPNPKQQKEDLLEQLGRSIMEFSTKDKVSTDVLTDRTVRTKVLTEPLINDLKVLHPYICEAPYANISFNELVYHFMCDTYPEGEIFWWQLHVLSVLHSLYIWTYPALALLKYPPPKASTLGDEKTLRKYYKFPVERRKSFHKIVFMLLMAPEQFEFNTPEELCILESTKNVCESRRLERIVVERGRALRYAKAYGSACSSCKSMGKGKMVCARCSKVFYCDKECQKAHWPVHKKECLTDDPKPVKTPVNS